MKASSWQLLYKLTQFFYHSLEPCLFSTYAIFMFLCCSSSYIFRTIKRPKIREYLNLLPQDVLHNTYEVVSQCLINPSQVILNVRQSVKVSLFHILKSRIFFNSCENVKMVFIDWFIYKYQLIFWLTQFFVNGLSTYV